MIKKETIQSKKEKRRKRPILSADLAAAEPIECRAVTSGSGASSRLRLRQTSLLHHDDASWVCCLCCFRRRSHLRAMDSRGHRKRVRLRGIEVARRGRRSGHRQRCRGGRWRRQLTSCRRAMARRADGGYTQADDAADGVAGAGGRFGDERDRRQRTPRDGRGGGVESSAVSSMSKRTRGPRGEASDWGEAPVENGSVPKRCGERPVDRDAGSDSTAKETDADEAFARTGTSGVRNAWHEGIAGFGAARRSCSEPSAVGFGGASSRDTTSSKSLLQCSPAM
eukprot:CAMPEP_0174840544 /NCGR_PEP_ID=MMETSP1114-20130205/8745_1 /TAXON_ID=312471 /ORGANISM="Neobodo designis, Strain CCAP 1951/1" /LENGTH=280 /DNA_ID=CAMNT_0016074699 /DNA_START=223 /DNA_END=1067 /DNA_ORIENTATION=-